jgi:hypothetical protein
MRYFAMTTDARMIAILRGITRLRDLSPLWEMFKEGVDLNSIEWSHH